MEKSNDLGELALQIEYLDDIAIIDASGVFRGGSASLIEEAMRKALERGNRHVVVDLYDNEGLDEDVIGCVCAALKVLLSSDPKAEFAVVNPRGTLERLQGALVYWSRMKEWSYYDRGDAIEGLRQRASARDMS